MMQNRTKQKPILLFCLISALLILLLCTKSSPIYPLNDWEDANIIFTVGKGMTQGKVPYRDLFDQKGPFSFFLYAVASLISGTSFTGLYILEALSFSVFLYYSYQTVCLYENRNAYLCIPVLGMLVASAMSFAHGGSIEELFLPAYAFSFYELLRCFRSDIPIRWHKLLLHGFLAGCMFWAKYTLTGFYIGWLLLLFLYHLMHRRTGTAFRSVFLFLAGMVIASVPWLIYYSLNQAMPDLWQYYFFNNIAGYGSAEENSLLLAVVSIIRMTGATLFRNLQYSVLIAAGILYLLFSRKTCRSVLERIAPAVLFLFATAGIYAGGTGYRYYGVVLTVFACLGWIPLLRLFNRCSCSGQFAKHSPAAACLTLLVSAALCLPLSSNTYMLRMRKQDLPQYRFAATMRSAAQDGSPSLLCYHMMDGGFYLTIDSVPDFRCFTWLNSATEEILNEQNSYLKDPGIEFVVTRNRQYQLDGFTVISEATYSYEEGTHTYYLYQRNPS